MKKFLLTIGFLFALATVGNAQSQCVDVEEIDGSPKAPCIRELKVTNGTLSCPTVNRCVLTISGGGGGSPGGADTYVQINDAGSFNGYAGFIFDKTSKISLGVAGASVGAIGFRNATSGTITLQPVTGALGTVTLSLPAVTDTLVGLAATQTLTNKTLSTSNTVSAALTWTAGVKQTFAPNGTTAGINVGSVAGDPSAPANGDLWYDSTANELTARINGANVALGSGGGGGITIGTTTITSGTNTRVLYNNAGVVGEYTVTGTAGNVVLSTSPTITTPAITTSQTTTRDSIGVTSTDGIVLQNTTAAAAGAQQYSPRLRLTGQGWKTTATAASQQLDWIAEVKPAQGSANPFSAFALATQINGGGYVPIFAIKDTSTAAGNATIYWGRSFDATIEGSYSSLVSSASGVTYAFVGTGVFGTSQGSSFDVAAPLNFTTSVGSNGSTFLRRLAAGVIQVAGAINGSTSGSLVIGTTSAAIGTSGVGVLAIANGTAPTSSPADEFQLYSADSAAGDANAFARNEAGEVNRLTGLSARVSTQFDKTSDTTLANVTGLSRNVEAGRTYAFTAVLYTTSNVAGGVKAAIGGTATATSVIYQADVLDGSTQATVGTARATSLATTVGDVTAVTAARITISGTIVVNAAGTLTVQFAQNASNGTASSVLVNSSFQLIPIS